MTAQPQSLVQPTSHRKTVQICWPDGRFFEAPVGATGETFINAVETRAENDPLAIAALVDGGLRELTFPLTRDANLTPITTAAEDGMRIYRRGLTFLLVGARLGLFSAGGVLVAH